MSSDQPAWTTAPAVRGRRVSLELPSALAVPLPVQVWAPVGLRARTPAPLLWCHDGPDYVREASLLQWAGAHIHDGSLPPFRLVLARPMRRMQWYSGSERYLRSVDRALDALRDRYAVERPLGVMGASLGGLTSMLVALRRPDVGAVLSQSGSFFWRGGPESDWRWFDRVVRHADAIKAGERRDPRTDLLVAMTCARREDNHDNNLAVARALRRQGLHVTWRAVGGGHDYASWRNALDPIWPNLLAQAWQDPAR